jgi:hypothetical protein
MNQGFQVGAVGVQITLYIKKQDGSAMDISTTTIKKIRLQPVREISIDYNASFLTNGIDGILFYKTIGNELWKAGEWMAQAYLSMPNFVGYTSITDFTVNDNLP